MLIFWQWLYDLSVSKAVREWQWLFPIFECIHIYSMVFLISLVAGFDLRLMGFTMGSRDSSSIREFSKVVLRWVWLPLALNVITGTLLFGSQAPKYSSNWAFVTKMVLISIGVAYHLIVLLKVARSNEASLPTLQVKVMSAIALVIWPGIIVASRWIAFVQ